ncbi:MAG: hypothetical protein BYD32DRAFT_411275, partial [Podila humilis]
MLPSFLFYLFFEFVDFRLSFFFFSFSSSAIRLHFFLPLFLHNLLSLSPACTISLHLFSSFLPSSPHSYIH